MEDFSHWPAEGIKDHEWVMSVSLKTFEGKLWGASQAMVRRSALRSRMGDRKGALQDAQAALGILPERAEYLVRAAEALLDDGQHEQAFEVFQRAAPAVEKVKDKQKAFLQTCVARLDRLLRPFDRVPNEVLALIFERVHADWEQLPSPFQVAHVCRRWRDLAFSTPSLWRDIRILRIATKLATVDSGLTHTMRRPPCFPSEDATPPVRYVHPRGGNHLKMINFCARKSRNTLTHYEIETLNNDPECRVFADAIASAATLESLSVINKTEGTSMYSDALDLVARCPKLATLELSLGDMDSCDALKLLDLKKAGLTTTPSFRTLKLHNFDFNLEPKLEVQQLFLQRCSQIESLTILDDECREPPLGLSQFVQQLLVRCADTLVNLETSGRASIFEGAERAGLTTLPKLRRFKHVDFAHPDQDHLDLDVDEFEFPQLEEIEGPYNVATSFPVVPKRYIFRVYDREDFAKIAEWLCDLEDHESPDEITVQAVDTMQGATALPKLVDALTPSKAGRVVCPKLTSFAYMQKDEILRRGPESSPFALELVPTRTPQFSQEIALKVDASCIAAMEAERRRVSEGLPPVAVKTKRAQESSTSPRADSQQQAAAAANDDDDGGEKQAEEEPKVWAPCEPLRSVTIEGCAVQCDVWSAMKTSPVCRYRVTPDPDEMSKLYPGPSNDRRRVYSEYCSF